MTKKYSNFSKGSEWNKWDLHVHTPCSITHHYGENSDETWEKYISDLEELAPEFVALGINDYLFLDGYERILDFKNKGRLSNIKLFLPVVEFRISHFAGVNFEGLKRINLHVIFADDTQLSLSTIKSQFLNTLQQWYKLENIGSEWHNTITKESVTELGRQIKESIPHDQLSKYGSDLEEGFNNLNIPHEEIFKSLAKPCFKGKYLICIGKTEWDELKWTDGSIATKKDIINRADIIFTAAESVEKYEVAKKKLTDAKVNDLLLDCSDAHQYSNVLAEKDRIGNCWTWIKADPTFEGLKQILYEPEGRVRIQQSKPDEKNEYEVIESIELSDSRDFNSQKIFLNPNLNTIIGGRSSGKSALLALIADKCRAYPKFGDKFENGESSYKKYLDTLSSFVTVHWQDGKLDAAHPIEYFPQGFLNTRQAEGLESVISPILGGDETLESYKRAFESEQRETSLELTNQLSELFRLKNEKTSTHLKIKELGEKEDIEKALKVVKDKSDLLTQATSIGPDQKASYEENVSKLQSTNKRIKQNSADKIQLEVFKDKEVINTSLLQQFDSLSTENKERLDDAFSQIAIEAKQKWKLEVENLMKICTDTIEADKLVIEQIESDPNFKATKDKFAQTTELSELQKKIQQESARLAEFEKESKVYTNLIENYNGQKDSIKSTWNKYWSNINDAAQKLKMPKNSQNPVADDLSVITKVQLKNEYREFLSDAFNQQRSDGDKLSRFEYESHEKYCEHVWQLFECALDGDMPWKGSYRENPERFINDLLTENWYELKHDVKYGGDSFEQMSAGKKAFVVLKLILDFSKRTCPILIDQPEDDLDNRAIYSELVTYIKSKKIDRQIILVTHNANVVVNADSELVIVANQQGSSSPNTSGKKFEYVAGSLELTKTLNTSEPLTLYRQGIREHVCEILEGGGRAFKLREKKYALTD